MPAAHILWPPPSRYIHSSEGKNNAEVGSTEAWPGLTVNLTGRDVAACYVTTPHSDIFSPTAPTSACPGFHKPRQNKPCKRDHAGRIHSLPQFQGNEKQYFKNVLLAIINICCYCQKLTIWKFFLSSYSDKIYFGKQTVEFRKKK